MKTHMENKKVYNARSINKMRFISGIVICSLVIIYTFLALILNLINYYEHKDPEAGAGTLRMFTTISNLIAAFAATVCLPFQIDGLRRDRYKLPPWVVVVMYVGAAGVFLTFFIAITVISAYQGFVKTMFNDSNLYLHTICPILISLLFLLVISDVKIKFIHSLIAIGPILVYMLLYYIMVFVTKQWRDHYYTDAFIPWPVALILLLGVAFGVCQLVRLIHNLNHKHVTKSIERYYKESPDYEFDNISGAIAHLAEIESKFYHEGDDISIPNDIIEILSSRYETESVPADVLYDIYLENYLISIGKTSK